MNRNRIVSRALPLAMMLVAGAAGASLLRSSPTEPITCDAGKAVQFSADGDVLNIDCVDPSTSMPKSSLRFPAN